MRIAELLEASPLVERVHYPAFPLIRGTRWRMRR